jgi:tRNA 2-selenouridine synthase
MGLNQISAEAAFGLGASASGSLPRFDAVLDARSPSEFAHDSLPAARNWPVLNDAERAEVGTLYKQVGALPARKLGAVWVARNIANHLERELASLPRDWQPLVYCWRGGQRSGSLAWFLAQIGFRTAQLEGGYKAYRALVLRELEVLPQRIEWHVLCGRTGSGKTRLLQALAEEGAQVLDLEALAAHRGSVLGALPGTPQPSQKAFENQLWQRVRALDPTRPVWVESESRKIGRVQLPAALLQQMHERGRVLQLELPLPQRVQLLLQDYAALTQDASAFSQNLQSLLPLRGRALVDAWSALAQAGRWEEAFAALTEQHYDPLYTQSTQRHYAGLEQARSLRLCGIDAAAMRAAAREAIDGP